MALETETRVISRPSFPLVATTFASWFSRHLWVLLPFLSLPALWPLITTGMLRSSDAVVHLLRLGLLDNHLQHGVLFPTWFPELVFGHGYPVFIFYGPATYYLAEFFHLLGFDYFNGLNLDFASLLLLAALGMYLLAQDIFGREQRWASLVAATAYLYAPYMLTNMLIRGDIAEFGAQALFPWVLWSMRRLALSQQPERYILPVALSLGGLAISHNVTLLFVVPAVAGYSIFLWSRNGRQVKRLGWIVTGLALAMGISTFLWLPMIAERTFLTEGPYAYAKTFLLSANAWQFGNFLSTSLVYKYTFDTPYQLGLAQAILAIAGFLLSKRRDSEWFFFLSLAVVYVLGISNWSLPLWTSSPLLEAVQFPWRLLSIVSLPMALFAGGAVLYLRSLRGQTIAAAALLALIVVTQRPQLDWMEVLQSANIPINPAVSAQIELETHAIGTTSMAEFTPRWVQHTSQLDATTVQGGIQAKITLLRSNAYNLEATIDSARGGALRFTPFYFPGWQVTLDQGNSLKPYPSTNMGLLTVDVPPGSHILKLTWVETELQRGAGWLSLLALAALTVVCWRTAIRVEVDSKHPKNGFAFSLSTIIPLSLLLFGTFATLWQRPLSAIQPPQQPVEAAGIHLLGTHIEGDGSNRLLIYPYWFVQQTPTQKMQVRWQLQDQTGKTVLDITSLPYYNTTDASNWAQSMIVSDAYQLTLPSSLAAGLYHVLMRPILATTDQNQPLVAVADYTLTTSVPMQSLPTHPLDISLGDAVRLAGYTLVNEAPPNPVTVVSAGQSLRYTLFWQATGPVSQNYHAFMHLVNVAGIPLVQRDQLPGPTFQLPMLWDPFHLSPDEYLLRIPTDAPSGLYWSWLGLYDFKTHGRLQIRDTQGNTLGDHYSLPAIKVLGSNPSAPQKDVNASLGTIGHLQGYNLVLPQESLQAGSTISLTTYYRSDQITDRDYTRFVHLETAAGTQVGGTDGLPAHGGNPTWSWVPGELIADPTSFTLDQNILPGLYNLTLGFYDSRADGARLLLRDRDGKPLPNNQVVLTQLRIEQ